MTHDSGRQGFWGSDSAQDEETPPAWLSLSHAVDEPAVPAPESDLDSTAQLPRLDRERVVVRVPTEEALQDVGPAPDEVADAVGAAEADDFVGAERDVDDMPRADASIWDDAPGADVLSWDDEPADAAPLWGDANPYEADPYEEESFGEESFAADQAAGAEDVEDADMAGRRRRMRRRIAIGVLVAALVAGYAWGVYHYEDRFLPGTSINGLEVADLTVEQAQAALEQETERYGCAVSVGGFTTTIDGDDIAVERDEARIAREGKARQSAFAWPFAFFAHPNLGVSQGVSYDEEALDALLTQAVEDYHEQSLPSDQASIDYDENQAAYVLSGSVTGDAVDLATVQEAVAGDVRALHATCTPDADVALRPATVQDLPSYAHAVEWANRVRSSDVPILVDGEQVAVAEASQNAQWVWIGDGPAVVVDEDALRQWADDSVQYAVFHSDDWSNYYLDNDAFVAGLSERLSTGVVDGYEAPTYDELRTEGESRERAYARGGWDSELGRYIDVDLEAQFARLFDEKGEVIWESAFVSGDMYEGHSTVTGTFEIYAMQTGTVLVGLDYNNDGEPDYQSYVNYWMPFYGGYGLHDATWRSSFGGEQYYYYGSHGCVNLPYSKAAELYELTHIGETVNVHW